MKDDFLGLTQGLTKNSFLESNYFSILENNEINGKTVINATSKSIENISVVFDEEQVIESIERVSDIIPLKDLKENFTLIRNGLRKDYDSCNTYPEDYIKKEPEELY